MGSRNPYMTSCQCKTNFFGSIQEAKTHARKCLKADYIYYVPPYRDPIKVWNKLDEHIANTI